jgi:hypothetical protein
VPLPASRPAGSPKKAGATSMKRLTFLSKNLFRDSQLEFLTIRPPKEEGHSVYEWWKSALAKTLRQMTEVSTKTSGVMRNFNNWSVN